MKLLKDAENFSIGPVGFAALPSGEERAFRAVLQAPGAREEFAALLSSATLEGRLYALLGLKLLGDPAYRENFKSYASDLRPVRMLEGCLLLQRPAKEIAEAIEQGRYK